jgi:hypothetical protein
MRPGHRVRSSGQGCERLGLRRRRDPALRRFDRLLGALIEQIVLAGSVANARECGGCRGWVRCDPREARSLLERLRATLVQHRSRWRVAVGIEVTVDALLLELEVAEDYATWIEGVSDSRLAAEEAAAWRRAARVATVLAWLAVRILPWSGTRYRIGQAANSLPALHAVAAGASPALHANGGAGRMRRGHRQRRPAADEGLSELRQTLGCVRSQSPSGTFMNAPNTL